MAAVIQHSHDGQAWQNDGRHTRKFGLSERWRRVSTVTGPAGRVAVKQKTVYGLFDCV